MNQVQMNAAKEDMLNWLAHPQEPGTEPAELECAGEFDLHDLHYYIFKYKKSVSDKWLLGVCGGYAGNELEHCGHVFSEMEEYNTDTAEQQAIDLVETIRNYWIEQAKQVEGIRLLCSKSCKMNGELLTLNQSLLKMMMKIL